MVELPRALHSLTALPPSRHPRPRFSVIVRTLNERAALARLLAAVVRQTRWADAELIVVDNASDDGTAELAASAGARVLTIPRGAFTYPRSMNLGCAAAAGELIVLTVGHAAPLRDNWLACAERHFADPQVAGVYGPATPPATAPLAERLVLGGAVRFAQIRGVTRIRRTTIGVLGATSCAIRTDLWRAHHFDERYTGGGEDTAWARWALAEGYSILRDPSFAVEHTHHLTLPRLVRQFRAWRRMARSEP